MMSTEYARVRLTVKGKPSGIKRINIARDRMKQSINSPQCSQLLQFLSIILSTINLIIKQNKVIMAVAIPILPKTPATAQIFNYKGVIETTGIFCLLSRPSLSVFIIKPKLECNPIDKTKTLPVPSTTFYKFKKNKITLAPYKIIGEGITNLL